MDKEKQAFEEWFSVASTEEELNFANYLYGENCYPIRFTRGFYGGYHARDAEIARLEDEIERKDAALNLAAKQLEIAYTYYKLGGEYKIAAQECRKALNETEKVE
jgi:hypothetical protein